MQHRWIAAAALACLPAAAATQPGRSTESTPATSARPAVQDTTAHRRTATSDTTARRRERVARHTGTRKSRTGTRRARTDSGVTTGSALNQTQSGVVNAKTGASTLGPRIKKTRPDQGEPTTSKGDTLKRGGDSVGKRARKRPS